jgi:hypothetical protein
MSNPRTIRLISPREPCGATWLINCLLELGVMTWRISPGNMWSRSGAGFTVHPREDLLRKWLPVLSRQPVLRFRDDVQVEWAHQFRAAADDRTPVLFFIRDPRDALLSHYGRHQPHSDLATFMAFPEPQTLLDKLDHFGVFTEMWLDHPAVTVIRFEDYRTDPLSTLRRAIEAIAIDVPEAELARAVAESTFEKAQAAEQRWHKERGEGKTVINSGRIGRWTTLPPHEQAVLLEMDRRFGRLMSRLGYERHTDAPDHPSRGLGTHARLVPFFDGRPGLPSDEGVQVAAKVVQAALSVTPEQCDAVGLSPHEAGQLLAGLELYLAHLGRSTGERFATFAQQRPDLASDYHEQMLRRTHSPRHLARLDLRRVSDKALVKLRILAGRHGPGHGE